jgi:hypothetical protein
MSVDEERAARASADPDIQARVAAYDAAGQAYGHACAEQSSRIWGNRDKRFQGTLTAEDEAAAQVVFDRKVSLQDALDRAWDALVKVVRERMS